jgi:hypothetical protein
MADLSCPEYDAFAQYYDHVRSTDNAKTGYSSACAATRICTQVACDRSRVAPLRARRRDGGLDRRRASPGVVEARRATRQVARGATRPTCSDFELGRTDDLITIPPRIHTS